MLIFMDDILIYIPTLGSQIAHLQEVFKILQEHQFFVKQSKCSFAQQSLEYLGHNITAEGVATDLAKVQAVNN